MENKVSHDATGGAFYVPCDTCSHKRHPDGGWCYMFREQPDVAKANQCGQHTGFQVGMDLLRKAIKVQVIS